MFPMRTSPQSPSDPLRGLEEDAHSSERHEPCSQRQAIPEHTECLRRTFLRSNFFNDSDDRTRSCSSRRFSPTPSPGKSSLINSFLVQFNVQKQEGKQALLCIRRMESFPCHPPCANGDGYSLSYSMH